MSPSTGRPRHHQRGPEGERPHQRPPRVCATGRSEAEDAVESTNIGDSQCPGAKRRACCATGGEGSTDPVPEARPVAMSKEPPGSSA
jgi:hypothetical protein